MRHPRVTDGAAVHRLIGRCPPLDLNSSYAYLLLCRHFASTSVAAEHDDGRLVGYVSGYLKPEEPDVLFIWQVAVDRSARGLGLGGAMLRWVLDSERGRGARFLETTIGPTNEASWRLFRGLARELGAAFSTRQYFESPLFGEEQHEQEDLMRIGPFDG